MKESRSLEVCTVRHTIANILVVTKCESFGIYLFFSLSLSFWNPFAQLFVSSRARFTSCSHHVRSRLYSGILAFFLRYIRQIFHRHRNCEYIASVCAIHAKTDWLISNNLVNALVCRDALSHHRLTETHGKCVLRFQNIFAADLCSVDSESLLQTRKCCVPFVFAHAIPPCILLVVVCVDCSWNNGAFPIIHWLIDFLARCLISNLPAKSAQTFRKSLYCSKVFKQKCCTVIAHHTERKESWNFYKISQFMGKLVSWKISE